MIHFCRIVGRGSETVVIGSSAASREVVAVFPADTVTLRSYILMPSERWRVCICKIDGGCCITFLFDVCTSNYLQITDDDLEHVRVCAVGRCAINNCSNTQRL